MNEREREQNNTVLVDAFEKWKGNRSPYKNCNDIDVFTAGVMYERRLKKDDFLLSKGDIDYIATLLSQKFREVNKPGSMMLVNSETRRDLLAYLNKLITKFELCSKGGGDTIICKSLKLTEEILTAEKKG